MVVMVLAIAAPIIPKNGIKEKYKIIPINKPIVSILELISGKPEPENKYKLV